MEEIENKVILAIKEIGPSVPVLIGRKVGMDAFFMNALLSTIKNKGLILSSYYKIGNSSLYYLKNQELVLRNIIFEKLKPQEKDLVKKIISLQKINQNKLTPTERFFLKKISDFIRIEKQENDYFIISKTVGKKQEVNDVLKNVEKENEDLKKPTEVVKNDNTNLKNIVTRKENLKESSEIKNEEKKISLNDDDFLKKVMKFFELKKIKIIKHTLIRKNTEHDFLININNNLIEQKYFLKSYNKKKINEKDLTQIWFSSQKKGLPTLLLTDGKLTKKALEFLEKELENKIAVIKF